jgi:hypothetical protein
MNKIHLALALHSHQPLGNFPSVIEDAFQKAYLPFLEILESFPLVKLNLHYSGILIDWIEANHPDYFSQLRELARQGRIELLGGGYYEPILPILPEECALAQVRQLSCRLESLFQKKPRGAWLAERVWEHPLAGILSQAEVEYVILDESHFLYAGLEPEDLTGYFITEEEGRTLKLIPGSKQLRYTIPFADPYVTVEYLRKVAQRRENALVVMGDDGEKFGAWPKTYKHVYEDRWLARFFEELEQNQEWLKIVLLSDYLQAFPPLRKVYIPNASYPEMMEWALPSRSREQQHRCMERLKYEAESDQLLPFIRGGYWRNFLAKYPEVDLIHKKMLAVNRRVNQIQAHCPPTTPRLREARECLLKAQCNDAYWHGVFGGIYAPHLRTELLTNLIKAGELADRLELELNMSQPPRFEQLDFDGDGWEELVMHHPQAELYFQLADGATLREIDFKPSAVPLVNSLKRQPEFYHRFLEGNAGSSGDREIQQGHIQLTPQERELDRLLRYDRHGKHCFRLYLFPAWKNFEDYDRQTLDEHGHFAAGSYASLPLDEGREAGWKHFTSHCPNDSSRNSGLEIIKGFNLFQTEGEPLKICCDFRFQGDLSRLEGQKIGIENVINFLAPTSWDRALFARESADSPWNFEERLSWRGVVEKRRCFGFIDGWRRVEVQLCFEQPVEWWIVPIYSVSRSEEGLEKIYQGTQVLAVLDTSLVLSLSGRVQHWLEIRKI